MKLSRATHESTVSCSTASSAVRALWAVCWSITALLLHSTLVATAAAVPTLKNVHPLGAQRGTTFTLTLVGQELTPGSELITTLPATISRLSAPKDKKPETELPFLIELPANAPVALYPLRLKSSDGISNVLLFSVSDFPEVEIEKEEGIKQKIPVVHKLVPPVIVNSTLQAGDQDTFKFTAEAGQTLVFEIEARRMASAIDPALRILDSGGREIAMNDDAPGIGVDSRVEVRFARAGEYRVVVYDSRFSDQEQNFYRLKVGNFLYADSIFPLGWQRGKDTQVTFLRGNLPNPVTIRLPLDSSPSQRIAMLHLPVVKGGAGSLPLPFVLGDLPEVIENGDGAMDLQADTVVNGRIAQPGERDLYRLKVRPGEKWLFEIQSAALATSRLSAHLGVFDTNMKLLDSAVDASNLIVQTAFSFTPPEKGVDPKMIFKVPEKVEELILSVEDITNRGGPGYGYRLRATRTVEDFSLELITPFINIPAGGSAAVAVRVIRDTYFGPIQLTVANARDELTIEGGHIPANVKEGLLVLAARPGTRLSMSELEIWGEGISTTKEPIRRRALGPGLITPVKGPRREVGGGSVASQKPHLAKWLGMQLPAGISGPPPISFDLPDREIKLVQGLKHDFPVKLISSLSLSSPIRIEGVQPGGIDVTIRAGTLDTKSNSVPVQMSSTFNTQIGKFNLVLVARTDVGGREVRATSPCVTVDLVRAFSLVIPTNTVQIESGAKAVLEGKVHRQYPFQEAVYLKVEDLPLHVTAAPMDVPYADSAFKLEFYADPAAEPGEYDIRLVSTAAMAGRKDNKDYTIPDLKLRLRIAGAGNAVSTERRDEP